MSDYKSLQYADKKGVEHEIPWFERKAEDFIDKTTILVGGTCTGKTTIVTEILHFCQKTIPNVLIIASESAVVSYKGKVPQKCIKNDLTKQRLEKIWERQSFLKPIFETANDIDVLASIFNKIDDRAKKREIDNIINLTKKVEKHIETSNQYSFAEKKSQRNNILKMCEERLKSIYKSTIRQHIDFIKKIHGLSVPEKTAIEFLDFNPRLLIVIDDCSEMFQKWMKYFPKGKEDNIFEKIFYKGRHYYITFILAVHDDKVIAPELRKNSRVTIFTSSDALVSAAQKQQSGFSGAQKKSIDQLAASIFDDGISGQKMHKKFCYIKDDPKPFRYMIADLYPDFSVGCKSLYDLANALPADKFNLDENPYLSDITQSKPKKKSNKRTKLSSKIKKY